VASRKHSDSPIIRPPLLRAINDFIFVDSVRQRLQIEDVASFDFRHDVDLVSGQERGAEDNPTLRLVGALLSVEVPNQIRGRAVGDISIIRTRLSDNQGQRTRT
jgi:hypothetical protein